MNCTTCGRRIAANSTFCSFCGASQATAVAPTGKVTLSRVAATVAAVVVLLLGLVYFGRSPVTDFWEQARWLIALIVLGGVIVVAAAAKYLSK